MDACGKAFTAISKDGEGRFGLFCIVRYGIPLRAVLPRPSYLGSICRLKSRSPLDGHDQKFHSGGKHILLVNSTERRE